VFVRICKRVPVVLGLFCQQLRAGIIAAAFWLAIGLPTVYLPLLFSEFNKPSVRTAFVTLVVLHAFTIVFGHRYG